MADFDLDSATPVSPPSSTASGEDFDLQTAQLADQSNDPNNAMNHVATGPAPPKPVSEIYYDKNGAHRRMSSGEFAQQNPLVRGIAGAGAAATDIVANTGNKLGLVDKATLDQNAQENAAINQDPAAQVGRFAGGALMTAPLAEVGGEAVGALGAPGRAIAGNAVTRGALEGAVQGGIQAKPGGTIGDMVKGGVAGGTLPMIGKMLDGMAHGVSPTDSARLLMGKGVDLTPGQMNPNSAWNQLESTATHLPFIGPAVKDARKVPENQTKELLVRSAAAPGAKLSNTNDLNKLTDEAYKSFNPAYAQFKDRPLQTTGIFPITGSSVQIPAGAVATNGSTMFTKTLAEDFGDAVNHPDVMASDDTRSKVSKWLQNQLTKAPKTTGDLLDMRSAIRTKIRGISQNAPDANEQADLLGHAEDAVTGAINRYLPPAQQKALAAVDGQYAQYKTIENAVHKGGDKPFTIFQASKAIKEATGKGQYARGGGGPLRDLTGAAADTFVDVPATGATLASLGPVAGAVVANPKIGLPAAGAAATLSLTKTGRQIAAGNTTTQRAARIGIDKFNGRTSPAQRRIAAQAARAALVQKAVQPDDTAQPQDSSKEVNFEDLK